MTAIDPHKQIMAQIAAMQLSALTATGKAILAQDKAQVDAMKVAGTAKLNQDNAIVDIMAAPIKNQIAIHSYVKDQIALFKTSSAPREIAIEKHNSGDYSTESYTGNKNIMVGGYDAREIVSPPEAHRAPAYVNSNASRVYVSPAIPGTPGVPVRPPTQVQIRRLYNKGWNTWARSINKLELNSCCRFSVPSGSEGAFIGIGGKGLESAPLAQFTHALVSDLRGVRVLEYGVTVKELAAFQNSTSKLRIQRQGTAIIYVLTTGPATEVLASSTIYPTSRVVYIYGKLYSSADAITDPEFLSGEVLFGGC